jgi:hypothetical protein
MCDFLSGFIHDDAATLAMEKRYLFGDLRSHSGTMELHGLKYGHPDVWREFEWTGEGEDSLVVRSASDRDSQKLQKVMLRDFRQRADLLRFACRKLPAGLTTLDLRSSTVPADLKLPAGLTTLYLRSSTVPADLKLPAGLTTLDLRYSTVPADLKLPAKCKIIR